MITELSVQTPLEVLTFVAEADKAVAVQLRDGQTLRLRFGGLGIEPGQEAISSMWEFYAPMVRGWLCASDTTLLRTLEGRGPYWLEVIHE